jgi:hypothetical protein
VRATVSRDPGRRAVRGGSTRSEITLGGRRVSVQRYHVHNRAQYCACHPGECATPSSPSSTPVKTATTAQSVPVNENLEFTVYVTRTGEKYHRDGCSSLRSSRIPMTLGDAAAKYGPCSLCKPSIASTVKPSVTPQPAAQPAPTTTSDQQCAATTQKGTRCSMDQVRRTRPAVRISRPSTSSTEVWRPAILAGHCSDALPAQSELESHSETLPACLPPGRAEPSLARFQRPWNPRNVREPGGVNARKGESSALYRARYQKTIVWLPTRDESGNRESERFRRRP